MDGFFIAKIECKLLKNETSGIFYRNVSSATKSAIINVEIADNVLVTIYLIQKTKAENKREIEFQNTNKPIFIIKISANDLMHFLQKTGDNNSIHKNENPIIPAFLILENLFKELGKSPTFFTIKYYNPFFLNQELKIFKFADNELVGLFNTNLIFKLQIIETAK